MKLLLTSADLLLNCADTHDCEHAIKVLKELTNKDCKIVFTSSQQNKLDKLPKEFQKVKISRGFKMSSGFIEAILEKTDFDSPQDIIVLGANDSDCIMAFNNKLLLFSAQWLSHDATNNKVFQYGIGLKNPDSLTLLIDNFLQMEANPWYYNIKVSDTTTLYSLTSANTGMEGITGDQAELVETFKEHLKEGKGDNRVHLLAYFMVSCHYNLEELREVNYIGIYPSSSSTENPDLEYFKETLRHQHKIMFSEPLLIRTKPTIKRHKKGKDTRLAEGCTLQFDSIIINPSLKGHLEGKTICIIDDFTTHGTSCETVRHLFEHEKVKSIIFITLGKFSRKYYKYDYEISGDVYSNYTFKELSSPTVLSGTFNTSKSAKELVERLGHILK